MTSAIESRPLLQDGKCWLQYHTHYDGLQPLLEKDVTVHLMYSVSHRYCTAKDVLDFGMSDRLKMAMTPKTETGMPASSPSNSIQVISPEVRHVIALPQDGVLCWGSGFSDASLL